MKTYWASAQIENSELKGATFPTPATMYLILFTAAPTAAYVSGGSGAAQGTEVSTSGTGYQRVAVDSDFATVSAANNGTDANTALITFNQATGNWGTVVAVGLIDSQTGNGNLWDFVTLGTPQAVNTGQQFQFPIGQFSKTES